MSPTVAAPIIACVAALLLTPMTSRLAHIKGWVDVPGLRKVHKSPVAYLGGAAVMGAFMIALGSMFLLPSASSFVEALDFKIGAIVLGALMMFATGLVDDVKNLKARTKLLVQLAAATLVVASGVSIDGITLTEDIRIEFGIFSVFITIFWIVGVTNAMNIIDGLDGLASGIAIVASGAIAWTAFQGHHDATGVLMLALMGGICGFLPYNMHPARVFLGDAGSLTIGFLLASSAALIATGAPTLLGIGVPLAALGIPILDTLFSMTRRLIERRSVLSPDRNHLHHRLIAMGYAHTPIVLFLSGATLTAVLAITTFAGDSHLLGIFALMGVTTAYALIFRVSGAVRIRESLIAVRRAATAAALANDERRSMDELQLQFEDATDIAHWWRAVVAAGESLSFVRMELALMRRDGQVHRLEWPEPARVDLTPASYSDGATFRIPIKERRSRTRPAVLSVTASPATPLGQVGHRISKLCKLMGDSGLSNICSEPTAASPTLDKRAVALRV